MLQVQDGAGVVEWLLDRPTARNAFDHELLDALVQAASDVAQSNARVVIISGAGGTFSAGGDIKLLGRLDGPAAAEAYSAKIQGVFTQIADLPQVVIAAVEGYALGGGMELAAACDVRVAAKGARFGTPEIDLGLFPAAGGIYRLPRLLGPSLARQLLLDGRPVVAEALVACGFINQLAEPGQALAQARTWAAHLAQKPASTLAAIKRVLSETASVPRDLGLALERHHFYEAFGQDAARAGIAAFLNRKRHG